MSELLQMDRNVLAYLAEYGGCVPYVAIPRKLFAGEIPPDHPDLVDMGLIEHDGDLVRLTERGWARVTRDHRSEGV